MKIITLFILLGLNSSVNAAEIDYQKAWCPANGGKMEVRVKGGLIDCLTKTHAIEFGFANKWKEDLAQARWYSLQTGKQAGYAMIFKKPSDVRYLEYLREYMAGYNIYIRVWVLTDY